jgi:hypothetical protein
MQIAICSVRNCNTIHTKTYIKFHENPFSRLAKRRQTGALLQLSIIRNCTKKKKPGLEFISKFSIAEI